MERELEEIKKSNYEFDELTLKLSSFDTVEELQNFQVLYKKIDFNEIGLKGLIEQNFVFDIGINPIEKSTPPIQKPKYHISLSMTGSDFNDPIFTAQPVSKIGKFKPSGSTTPILGHSKHSPGMNLPRSGMRNKTFKSTVDSSPDENDFGSLTERPSLNSSFNSTQYEPSRNLKLNTPRNKLVTSETRSATAIKNRLPTLLYSLIPEVQAVATFNPITQESDKLPITKREACLEGSSCAVASNYMVYITGGFQSSAKKAT